MYVLPPPAPPTLLLSLSHSSSPHCARRMLAKMVHLIPSHFHTQIKYTEKNSILSILDVLYIVCIVLKLYFISVFSHC